MLQAVGLMGQKESAVPKLECLGIGKRWVTEADLEERLTLACEAVGVKYTEDCFCLPL